MIPKGPVPKVIVFIYFMEGESEGGPKISTVV